MPLKRLLINTLPKQEYDIFFFIAYIGNDKTYMELLLWAICPILQLQTFKQYRFFITYSTMQESIMILFIWFATFLNFYTQYK